MESFWPLLPPKPHLEALRPTPFEVYTKSTHTHTNTQLLVIQRRLLYLGPLVKAKLISLNTSAKLCLGNVLFSSPLTFLLALWHVVAAPVRKFCLKQQKRRTLFKEFSNGAVSPPQASGWLDKHNILRVDHPFFFHLERKKKFPPHICWHQSSGA